MGISGHWKRYNWKRDLLKSLTRTGGNVTISCQLVGISRKCAYKQKNKDPEFSALWDAAVAKAKNRRVT